MLNNYKFYRKYKTAIKPAVVTVAMVVLSLFAVNIFWNRIADIRAEIGTDSSQKEILEGRLSTLQGVIVEAEESSGLLSFALPQSNPAIFIISHLNLLSSDLGISLENMSLTTRQINPEAEEVFNKVNIDFDASGDSKSIYEFITSLSRIIPLVNIEDLKIDSRDERITAGLRLTSFYAPLPTQLPPITSPLSEFTDQEKSTINFLQEFNRPSVGDGIVVPQDLIDQNGRVNPFESVIEVQPI